LALKLLAARPERRGTPDIPFVFWPAETRRWCFAAALFWLLVALKAHLADLVSAPRRRHDRFATWLRLRG